MTAYKTNLVGSSVKGTFSGKFYTGVVVESVKDFEGHFNHIIKLHKPIVLTYDNPTQTKRNNTWKLNHVNYNTSYQEKVSNKDMLILL